jgi:raffinose/stachyose/melibiose transport system permease protein
MVFKKTKTDLKRDEKKTRTRVYNIKRSNTKIAFGFLVVPLIFYTIFVIIPVFQSAYFGFFKWNGLGSPTDFVYFKNFIDIIKHDVFHKALINNFLIIALSLLFQLPVALLLALAIGRRLRGSVIFRSIFFLPFILSEVIAGTIWRFIYHPQFGLSKSILADIFPSLKTAAFMGDPQTVFYAIFVVLWWKYFGLHMILYIAGLQNIPEEIEEAAYIDGANDRQLNWHIIIPLLKPAIIISVFFCVIGSLQTFDIIWAMGRGGPVNSAETMVTYLYNFGFQGHNLGYGSAVAIIIFLFCLVFNILYQKFTSEKEKM